MATGLLIQPELVIAWIRNDPDDPLWASVKDFFENPDNAVYPALSAVSFGIANSSIESATGLSQQQKSALQSALRSLQRNRDGQGSFYGFELDAATEWADVRFHCRQLAQEPTGEVQMEYAIARANQLEILAPRAGHQKYPQISNLTVRYL